MKDEHNSFVHVQLTSVVKVRNADNAKIDNF